MSMSRDQRVDVADVIHCRVTIVYRCVKPQDWMGAKERTQNVRRHQLKSLIGTAHGRLSGERDGKASLPSLSSVMDLLVDKCIKLCEASQFQMSVLTE